MKSFLKGILVIAVFIILFIGIPSLLGFFVVQINWPESLIEYASGYSHSQLSLYAHIGGNLLLLFFLVFMSLLSVKYLGDAF